MGKQVGGAKDQTPGSLGNLGLKAHGVPKEAEVRVGHVPDPLPCCRPPCRCPFTEATFPRELVTRARRDGTWAGPQSRGSRARRGFPTKLCGLAGAGGVEQEASFASKTS